jgi:hypothetical protein
MEPATKIKGTMPDRIKQKDKKLATFCSNIAGKRLKITCQRSKIALALQKDIVN